MFSLKSMLSSLPSVGNKLGKFPSSVIKLGECKTFSTPISVSKLHTPACDRDLHCWLHLETAKIWWEGWSCLAKPCPSLHPQKVRRCLMQRIFLSYYPRHRAQQHWHTWGIFKTAKMNVVDNSALGRKAMAEGRPPKVIGSVSLHFYYISILAIRVNISRDPMEPMASWVKTRSTKV